MARVVVNVPAEAKRGEVIEIRTLAGHRDGDRLSPHAARRS